MLEEEGRKVLLLLCVLSVVRVGWRGWLGEKVGKWDEEEEHNTVVVGVRGRRRMICIHVAAACKVNIV